MAIARQRSLHLKETILAFNTVRFGIIAIALVMVSVVWASSPAARGLAGSAFAETAPAPHQATGPQQATLSSIRGEVSVRSADAIEFASAGPGTRLYRGDAVQTGKNGVAEIIFADGTRYSVKADTLVVIQKNQ